MRELYYNGSDRSRIGGHGVIRSG